MQERLTEIVQSLKDINEKLSKKNKMYIISGVLLVVFVAAGFWLVQANKPYEVLFTGISEKEMTELVGRLHEMEVDIRTSADGTILVPKEQEPQIKATLVSEGYPKNGGFTYDVFKTNVGMMATDTEKNFFELADLQERIASTIMLFDGVKNAKVTIALGDDKKYILESEKVENTAAVTVVMKNGGSPTPEQVVGIKHLTARSIPGVAIDKVTIIDGNGRDVSAEQSLQATATQLKQKLERDFEDSARVKILHLLNPIYGEDKVRVAVTSVVDIDKKMKEIINYIPSQDNKGVISSENTYLETTGNGVPAGGVPGTDTNADIPTYPGVTADGEQLFFADDKAYNYLVSQVKEQIETEAGTLLDMKVGITIDAEQIPVDKMLEIKRVVANASGISVDDVNEKIQILATPFVKDEVPEVLDNIFTSPAVVFGISGFAFFLLLLVIILILRGKKKKKKKLAAAGVANDDAQAEDLRVLEALKNDASHNKENHIKGEITSFIHENPEISAQLIKTWLRGGEKDE